MIINIDHLLPNRSSAFLTGQIFPARLADVKGVTVAQLNIAGLLHRSDWILPIPGTTSIQHLEENISAADIALSEDDLG